MMDDMHAGIAEMCWYDCFKKVGISDMNQLLFANDVNRFQHRQKQRKDVGKKKKKKPSKSSNPGPNI